MTTRLVIAAAVAVAVALTVTPVAAAVARRTGVVDRPGDLKPQSAAVPYLGGVAVFLAAVIGGALGRPLLLVPLALALALGVADDATGLPPAVRLAGQLAIGGVVAAVVPTHLPGALGPVLVVLVAVLLMNGVNMIDGLDALAGGCLALATGAFAWLLRGDGRLLGLALACALAGFLVFNRPPASIYLGDGGAYLLGTALTVLLALAWAPGERTTRGVAGLLVVAVPAAEVLFAVIRRLRSRRSMMAGDRGHPYDRLVARGWPRLGATLAYVGAELVLVAVALAVATSRSAVPAVGAAIAAGLVLLVVAGLAGGLVPDPLADP